jgi:hypothetical protein
VQQGLVAPAGGHPPPKWSRFSRKNETTHTR